ncbi:hypothetical protein ALC62_14501 [Cyphomyrmex costatus]|uniref:Uncharacterized protein n=1 Tax=Cyphomyrmex costatus TaxID=456900 RepID=A0A195C403_9HYME|nr:hypothetical protein ALC62_14501 [Cyphomyrmex costatus]
MFDAISGDAIRLKSQTVEAIPSVLPAKWLVTRVPMSAHKAVCTVSPVRGCKEGGQDEERERDGGREKETKKRKETNVARKERRTLRRVKYVPEAFVVPPHRRNNLSASVSRPRERLCMIYSRIRRNTGGARERERERGGGRGRARDAGEQVERRGVRNPVELRRPGTEGI